MSAPQPRAVSPLFRALLRGEALTARSSWLSAFLVSAALSAQEVHIPLHSGWQFQQVGKEQWYPAQVPGVVHTDLLRNGLIPDPYQGCRPAGI